MSHWDFDEQGQKVDFVFFLLLYVCYNSVVKFQTLLYVTILSERGVARTGYFIPGRDGRGAGGGWKFFRRRTMGQGGLK